MSAEIIDGARMGEQILNQVSEEINSSFSQRKPLLANLSIEGDDKSSKVYIKNQVKAAAKVGIQYKQVILPKGATQQEAMDRLLELNRDQSVDGVIIQRPLPQSINASPLIDALDPNKDVEGMHPKNLGAIVLGAPNLIPCTAQAAIRLFLSLNIPPKGLEVVVVGHSEIVGKPIALLLVHQLATITVCHIGTKDLKAHTLGADLLFVATGVPGLITKEMVKPGAIVIDIGINRVLAEPGSKKKYRLVGDVDFEGVKQVASHITPVPGGVGPVTTAILMENTLKAARA